ncbi:MAG TPA: toprim domain-containing protein [Candidatus Paceibacterota bacterium]|jgi:hypothetical protein|nr:toprim domain-containing protein [Candidatus Paceibacterota bacterium]
MEKLQTITIKEYLTRKGIPFKEQGGELITHCLFNNCDNDSRDGEAHLYFDTETGQYNCKKCGAKGNIITLAEYLGDNINDIVLNPQKSRENIQKYPKFDASLVEICHQAIPAHIRQYLNARGITDALINDFKLGWGEFYGKWWITIPIKDINGNFVFFKLRQDPNEGDEKITYPRGIEAQIYDWETLKTATDKIVICEGEFDRLILLSKGISAITSTHGAMTFKQEWCKKLVNVSKIYICFDNDETGKKGAERVAKMVKNDENKTYIITLPEEVGESGDITDYFTKLNGNSDDLFDKYAKEYPEKIDTSQFKPLSSSELIKILGLTIKKDEENKLITFLCELSAYTENSQFNISFNAPSSTGKSYIPTEVARLFPEEDVIEIGYCSPTAFFHDIGEYQKEKNGYLVDLSRKILIFLDQPHTQLLERLRPLLSHDKKEINLKITDKTQKFGLKTKNVLLRGYPSVIFCTVGLKIDEQEATRFLLLSPEINQEKIREAIHEKIKKETDADTYQKWLDDNPERKLLKERIRAIKQENIREIKIGSPEKIEERFFKKNKMLKPRHSRDIGRLISLIKSFALLNLWFREKDGSAIVANDDDIEEAFKIWEATSESQELNLSPYIFDLYKNVILPLFEEKNQIAATEIVNEAGILRQEIIQKNYQLNGRLIPDWELRLHIIPMLENAGLIRQEADPNDKRKMLIYPTTSLTISKEQNNSELNGGVNKI